MAVVTLNCGNCKFSARIEATADAEGNVGISISSDCPRVQEFGQVVQSLSGTCAAGWKCASFFIWEPAAKANLHPACPVPTAVLKATEVAGGLALPQDVVMHFEE